MIFKIIFYLIQLNGEFNEIFNIESVSDDPEEINGFIDDMHTLSSITEDIELRDYGGTIEMEQSLAESSPFAMVNLRSGGFKIVRKSSIVWLLTKNRGYFSSDRLQRVKENDILKGTIGIGHSHITIDSNEDIWPNISVKREIFIGDWVVCVVDENVLIGLVLSFSYIHGKTYRQREYTLNYTELKPKSDVGILCNWYESHGGILKSVDYRQQNYINILAYKSTLLKAPTIVDNNWQISVRACNEIKNVRNL